MKVSLRHHMGLESLLFTAFSGSHQDLHQQRKRREWKIQHLNVRVPYLPIDLSDVGRDYGTDYQINSQSRKRRIAYVLDTYFGIRLPKRAFLRDFSASCQV